jgi:uncharacterized phiE125 gp8 family phage protein
MQFGPLTNPTVLNYSIHQTVAPAEEPVTLAELKAHLYVPISDDDALITSLGIAARLYYEAAVRRQLVTAQYELRMDWWPADVWFTLPYPPLASVQSINFVDVSGNSNLWDPSNYYVDTRKQPGVVQLAWNVVWPNIRGYHDSVIVAYTAGYGAASAVPEIDKLAIKELTALWYVNREAATETPLNELPDGLQNIIRMRRVGGYP